MSAPGPSLYPSWKNFPKQEIAKLCLAFGSQLTYQLEDTDDESGIDDRGLRRIIGSQLLFAIAGCESSFGANCEPRFEPAFHVGGLYYKGSVQMKEQVQRYGTAAACSYGPWQLMLCNAPGFTPLELATDAEKAIVATIGHLKRFVFGVRNARTLSEIADVYNSGSFRDAVTPPVAKYIARLTHNYYNEVIAL